MSFSRTLRFPTRSLARARFASTSTSSGPCTKYTAVTHPDITSPTPRELEIELERATKYTLPVYARPPIVLVRGKKRHVWDTQDRKYLDFMAGVAVNALGHADEGVINVCIYVHFSFQLS